MIESKNTYNNQLDSTIVGLGNNIHQLEEINLRLCRINEVARGSISGFRNQMYEKTIGLYQDTDDLISYMENDILLRPMNNYDSIRYAFIRLEERYRDVKINIRRAELNSFKSEVIKPKKQKHRKEYLDDKKLVKLTQEDQLLDKNQQITERLEHITQVMNGTVVAGEQNLQNLSVSTSGLQDLSNKYGRFADILIKTNDLVKMINETSGSERRQIYRSIYFFIGVCIFIIYKRILKRPIKLMIWILFSLFKYLFLGGKKVSLLAGDSSNTDSIATVAATLVNSTLNNITTTATSLTKDEL